MKPHPLGQGENTSTTGHGDALCIPSLPRGQDASLHVNFSRKADFFSAAVSFALLVESLIEIARRLAPSVPNQLYRTCPG
jgi:hypothetical protein